MLWSLPRNSSPGRRPRGPADDMPPAHLRPIPARPAAQVSNPADRRGHRQLWRVGAAGHRYSGINSTSGGRLGRAIMPGMIPRPRRRRYPRGRRGARGRADVAEVTAVGPMTWPRSNRCWRRKRRNGNGSGGAGRARGPGRCSRRPFQNDSADHETVRDPRPVSAAFGRSGAGVGSVAPTT